MNNADRSNEIYACLEQITECLEKMSREERIAWFRKSAYVKPLNFLTEADGTIYAVRTFFRKDAQENIAEKVQRLLLGSTEKPEQI